ncbi:MULTISPECIES: molybdopterin converting factor subunit 1 [Sutcliffiella]|uniref:Molybdopterin synthase sulfur carrier subunit n=1 Tax=Sutcliffiella cohnii TaxID=33932 RepID=A0A223KLN2_9BACI|nr:MULTISPECIES: molybdopterin converting factor subunit 1 [Sutcliffiella]AST90395.1 molybdopterin converting factor subunit 1 [Sutcliffiella cohnii]MED4017489.1 molybdopterin converting factor subunit 1 [Sutcliffiella cohnii]WBL16050.1 molybdopterin converting factor subunit 1 [Sutcliffiella sp. NC1]
MIKVLLFSYLQEAAGAGQLEIDSEQLTVLQLKEKLNKEYELTNLQQVMVAINEEYATDEQIIASGDTVALIPPVSGG